MRSTNTYTIIAFEDYFLFSKQSKLDKFHLLLYDNLNGSCASTVRLGSRVCNRRSLRETIGFCVREIKTILENCWETTRRIKTRICRVQFVSTEVYRVPHKFGTNKQKNWDRDLAP